MSADAASEETSSLAKPVRPWMTWRRVLLAFCMTVLAGWLLYRTTIYLTIAQLDHGRVINDDETTKWRIRISVTQLIANHQRTVDACRHLSDREIIGTGDLKKFNERIAAWNALSMGATISHDVRLEQYMQQHLDSSNRWTSEGPPH